MIRIITDSAADITLEEAKKNNIDIVPLKISFNEDEIKQEKTEDFDLFYQKLMTATALPLTSRPSPEQYLEYFKKAEEKGDDVLVLTLSSGLSGTYESAMVAKKMSPYKEKITIIDTEQAILTQRMLVEYAVQLRDSGEKIETITEKVNDLKDRVVVCGLVNTLKYLKMGGRIPKSLAFIGEKLNIKPIIILEDKSLKELSKKRGRKAGKKSLQKELEKEKLDPDFPVYFGYTLNKEEGYQFRKETEEKYQLTHSKLFSIGGVIGTHVGPESLAIAFVREK